MNKKKLFEAMLRARGITKQYVFMQMNITRPTLIKILNEPMYMNGRQRKKFANILGIDVSFLDSIINYEKELSQLDVEHILYGITKIKNKIAA